MLGQWLQSIFKIQTRRFIRFFGAFTHQLTGLLIPIARKIAFSIWLCMHFFLHGPKGSPPQVPSKDLLDGTHSGYCSSHISPSSSRVCRRHWRYTTQSRGALFKAIRFFKTRETENIKGVCDLSRFNLSRVMTKVVDKICVTGLSYSWTRGQKSLTSWVWGLSSHSLPSWNSHWGC